MFLDRRIKIKALIQTETEEASIADAFSSVPRTKTQFIAAYTQKFTAYPCGVCIYDGQEGYADGMAGIAMYGGGESWGSGDTSILLTGDDALAFLQQLIGY